MSDLSTALSERVHKAMHTALANHLLQMTWQHAANSGDHLGMTNVIAWAHANGMADLLPQSAKDFAAAHSIGPHNPDPVQKASPILVAKGFTIMKAWSADNGDTYFEGWASVETRDLEKDIVPPECFTGALDDYMASFAPVSSEHNMKKLPVGHMQCVALVRDGQVFKSASHPTDPAEFVHFPGLGTGVYGRGVVNTPGEAHAVAKGNLGGMSWVGYVEKSTPLPDGGKKYEVVYPLIEMTLAAYPVNPRATVHAIQP